MLRITEASKTTVETISVREGNGPLKARMHVTGGGTRLTSVEVDGEFFVPGSSSLTIEDLVLNEGERFFYENGAYSWDQLKETEEAGRCRCAIELAKAERWARDEGLYYEWSDDSCIGGDCEPCSSGSPHVTLQCTLYRDLDATQEWLASLGGICEPTEDYKRVVRAELASEAMKKEGTR